MHLYASVCYKTQPVFTVEFFIFIQSVCELRCAEKKAHFVSFLIDLIQCHKVCNKMLLINARS